MSQSGLLGLLLKCVSAQPAGFLRQRMRMRRTFTPHDCYRYTDEVLPTNAHRLLQKNTRTGKHTTSTCTCCCLKPVLCRLRCLIQADHLLETGGPECIGCSDCVLHMVESGSNMRQQVDTAVTAYCGIQYATPPLPARGRAKLGSGQARPRCRAFANNIWCQHVVIQRSIYSAHAAVRRQRHAGCGMAPRMLQANCCSGRAATDGAGTLLEADRRA